MYRQKFRGHRKGAAETYFAYAREKRNLFDRWRIASDVTGFTALRELILLEEFEKKSAWSPIRQLKQSKDYHTVCCCCTSMSADRSREDLMRPVRPDAASRAQRTSKERAHLFLLSQTWTPYSKLYWKSIEKEGTEPTRAHNLQWPTERGCPNKILPWRWREGNDIAGGNVDPSLQVLEVLPDFSENPAEASRVFSACTGSIAGCTKEKAERC